jgi:NitT/TauT family transport system substrate-binding protein
MTRRLTAILITIILACVFAAVVGTAAGCAGSNVGNQSDASAGSDGSSAIQAAASDDKAAASGDAAAASGDAAAAAGDAAAASDDKAAASEDRAATGTATKVRVASLKGPTSIGIVKLISEAAAADAAASAGTSSAAAGTGTSSASYNYDFSITGTADEILPKIVAGDIDIALVPANIAAVLYNRSNGGIQALNINTLGVLYVVTADDSIDSFASLRGRTVLMTGKGTTPEYAMNALLAAQNITDINLEFKSEATELAAALSANPSAIAVLPQPYVAAVTAKNPSLKVRISLSDVWDAVFANKSRLVTGVTIVNTNFAANNPQAVSEFLRLQQESVAFVTANPSKAAPLVVEAGIIDNNEIAAAAIPLCSLVCISGEPMQDALGGYYAELFAQDASSVGGSLPDVGFYWQSG